MLWPNLVDIGPVVLEKKFPLEKDVALYLNKLEFPSLKDALWQI